jgi:hypothetical protein
MIMLHQRVSELTRELLDIMEGLQVMLNIKIMDQVSGPSESLDLCTLSIARNSK